MQRCPGECHRALVLRALQCGFMWPLSLTNWCGTVGGSFLSFFRDPLEAFIKGPNSIEFLIKGPNSIEAFVKGPNEIELLIKGTN